MYLLRRLLLDYRRESVGHDLGRRREGVWNGPKSDRPASWLPARPGL